VVSVIFLLPVWRETAVRWRFWPFLRTVAHDIAYVERPSRPNDRGRRTVKEAVDRVLISTSGPELWRFEFSDSALLGGQLP